MKEINELIKGQELVVRKRLTNFIQKLLKRVDYEISHIRYKHVVYAEDRIKTIAEEKIKNIYDAFMYLISNRCTPISGDLLNKFFFIYLGKEMDNFLLLRLQSKYFYIEELAPIEKAIEYHLYIYEELNEVEENDRYAISIMFLNYILIKNGIPGIQLFQSDFVEYDMIKEDYKKGDKGKMYLFLTNLIKKQKFQSKDYYKNLNFLDEKIIIKIIKEQQDTLMKNFNVKKLYLYGSFANGEGRYDSDIDLIISLSADLLLDEKMMIMKELSNYLKPYFNRFIDIQEINEYLDDDFVKYTGYVKKIF